MSRLILFVLLVAPCIGFTQTRKITGTVVAFNRFPLKNVAVEARKAKTETVTDDKGHFEIEVKNKDVIRIREDAFIEYSKKVSQSQESLRINLFYEHNDENMKKVTQGEYISRKDLEYGLNNLHHENNVYGQFIDIFDAIKYAIPNSTITVWDGQRGIEFRGHKTFSGISPLALLVVDGQIISDVSFISPMSILTIKKLEGSAIAIYGARASNGVILIETR